MVKVLNSDYLWTKNELKKDRRGKKRPDMEEIQEELEERYLELKKRAKRKRKHG